MFSLLNGLQDNLKLYEGFFSSKISFIISGAIPFLTYRFLLQGLANIFRALLQICLDQEVQKSSNYSDKLI